MEGSQNITKSTLLTILSQLPAHAFGIFAGIFIARILGPEGKGEYAMFFANMELFRTIFGFSIINSIIFFVANKQIDEKKLKTIITYLLLGTVLLSVIFLIIGINTQIRQLLFSVYDYSFVLCLLFIFSIFISQINAIFTSYFQGLRHFRIVNKILIINSIYGFVFFSIMYFMHINSYCVFELVDIVWVSIIILLFNTAHWYIYYLNHGTIAWDFKLNWKVDFKTFFKFTGMNHMSNVLLFFNNRLILWIVAYYLDNWELGIFSLGMGLAQLLYLFSNPLTLILESFLSSDKEESRGELFSRFARIQFTIIFLVCLIVAICSPYLVPFIYGEEFSFSVQILNFSMIGVMLSCQSSIVSSFFLANNQLNHNVISSAIGILITIVLSPILIQEFHLLGAVFTQILTYLGIFIYLLIVVRINASVNNNLFFITYSDVKFIMNQLETVKLRKKEN